MDNTLLGITAMLGLNFLGWAFTLGTLWQKVNSLEKHQEHHEGLPIARAHSKGEK